MRSNPKTRESGVVMAAVLMTLATLSLLVATGKGDTALQWAQLRNARDYGMAVRLADTGIARALSTASFSLRAVDSGRYCRTPSRCVDWTVRYVESTPVPEALASGAGPERALHFEVASTAEAGRHASASAVLGFLVLAPGQTNEPLPDEVRVCASSENCPPDASSPPIRRYWREGAE
ncbi:hypothetical protein [Candidatus Foliamicus sp.]